jgi:predicted GH43/DUF377 family glycosyl hydrolase
MASLRFGWLPLLALSGCSLITKFDPSQASESSAAQCSDGVDNDADGLTDCQDFKCLSQPVCCNLPVIVLADDFQHRDCAQATCDQPDPTCTLDAGKWQPWGLPQPILCNGGLSPHKAELCYDVGALGQAPLPLHPGLSVAVTVAGIPETAGQLAVGLTRQPQVGSGNTPCALVQGFQPEIAAIEARSTNGYVFLASFDHSTVAESPEITDDGAHAIRMQIGSDRRVIWLLDGVEFAQSPADQALPGGMNPLTARLGLAGRGLNARFLDARVSDGTQCDAPNAWVPNDGNAFVALSGADDNNKSWDSYQVFAPAVTTVGNQVMLYYSGCTASSLDDSCSQELGIGLATSADQLSFARAPTNPLYPPRARFGLEPGLLRDPTGSSNVTLFISVNALASQQNQEVYRETSADQMQFMETGTAVLQPGPPGSWDDGEVCCSSVLPDNGGLTMWFAGHSKSDGTWRIGVARSSDGFHFTEDPANPVVREGANGDFDQNGVDDPEVLFDDARKLYRMWYTGNTVLGETALGYAVSTDGVRWHKFPGNPVLRPLDVGLQVVGSPAVLADEGELRMWLQGRADDPRLHIYALSNRGKAPQ